MRSLHHDEAGTGLIGTVAGVGALLFLLLFAVQVSATLYATSVTTAAGYDAARGVAAAAIDHNDPGAVRRATRHAEARFRQLLGSASDDAELDWEVDGAVVRLRVRVAAPAVLPVAVAEAVDLRRVERTFVVRVERVQAT